ncbi:MAG: acyltransferase family protein [Micromonosporaceae bacterium]
MTSSTAARTRSIDHNVTEHPGPAPAGPDAGVHRPRNTAASGTPSKPRDALLDNAKFLLITLVVLGHVVSPTEHGRIGSTVYVWIYVFHMPAFVLISGYLSRSMDGSARRIDKLLSTVAAPYLVFWSLYGLQAWWADRKVPDGLLEPVFLTWFLVALFVWRLTTPLWRRVRWPIPVAIAISLVGGLTETGEILGMSRIVSLLPFFVAGLYLEPRHFEYLKQGWVRACSILVIPVTGAIAYLYLEPMSREWLYWRETLADRDFEVLPYGLPARAVFMVLAFALSLAVLSLIPRRRLWFTDLGAYTMYVFLWHGLVVRLAEQAGWYEFTAQVFNNRVGWALNATLAVGLTFVLCSPWVRKATKWAVEPNLDWLLLRYRKPVADVTAGAASRDGTNPPDHASR